jgi:hypothetical protein
MDPDTEGLHDLQSIAAAVAATGDLKLINEYQQWWIARFANKVKKELDVERSRLPGFFTRGISSNSSTQMDPALESRRETLKLLMEINSIPIDVKHRAIKDEMERIGVTEVMRKQARALRMVGSVDEAREVERIYLNGEKGSIADLGDESDETDEVEEMDEEETDEEEGDEMEDGESDEMEEEESDEKEEGRQTDEHLESRAHGEGDPPSSRQDPL